MNKKMIAPIVIAALILIYCIGLTILFIFLLNKGMPIWMFLILLIGPLIAGIAIIYMLVERAGEIKGGEEDEASKY